MEGNRICVLQGAILGPILLNILYSNLYLGIDHIDLASDADDNNIYYIGDCMSSFFRESNVRNVFPVLSW